MTAIVPNSPHPHQPNIIVLIYPSYLSEMSCPLKLLELVQHLHSSPTHTQKTRVPPAASGSWPTAAMYVPIAEGHRTLHVGSLATLGVLIAATGRGRGPFRPLTRHFPALPALDHTGPLFSDTKGSNNQQLFALDFLAHKLSDSCRVGSVRIAAPCCQRGAI